MSSSPEDLKQEIEDLKTSHATQAATQAGRASHSGGYASRTSIHYGSDTGRHLVDDGGRSSGSDRRRVPRPSDSQPQVAVPSNRN
jgi:hypothetical protein